MHVYNIRNQLFNTLSVRSHLEIWYVCAVGRPESQKVRRISDEQYSVTVILLTSPVLMSYEVSRKSGTEKPRDHRTPALRYLQCLQVHVSLSLSELLPFQCPRIDVVTAFSQNTKL